MIGPVSILCLAAVSAAEATQTVEGRKLFVDLVQIYGWDAWQLLHSPNGIRTAIQTVSKGKTALKPCTSSPSDLQVCQDPDNKICLGVHVKEGKCPGQNCYEDNKYIHGEDVGNESDIIIPSFCEDICRDESKCKSWMWHRIELRCYMKGVDMGQNLRKSPNAISGPKICADDSGARLI